MVRQIEKKDRNKATRKIKNILLISAEGNNKTESIYFLSFNQIQRFYRIQMATGNKTDPKGIVEDMIKTMKREQIDLKRGDLAVCVFDTDFGQYKSSQIEEAKALAYKHGIEIIVSNPCFEVWFIEHFGFTTKHFNSNAEVVGELKTKIPNYTKSMNLHPILLDKTSIAIKNCKRLEYFHESIGNVGMNKNPSSEVYKIVETINGDSKVSEAVSIIY
ncbi:MAG: RloB family protein [Erysipelotrichaceae bacterium]|nr:RloB family protein [Erysipelotrichaceae bacterium]